MPSKRDKFDWRVCVFFRLNEPGAKLVGGQRPRDPRCFRSKETLTWAQLLWGMDQLDTIDTLYMFRVELYHWLTEDSKLLDCWLGITPLIWCEFQDTTGYAYLLPLRKSRRLIYFLCTKPRKINKVLKMILFLYFVYYVYISVPPRLRSSEANSIIDIWENDKEYLLCKCFRQWIHIQKC